jgi:hypothetical protein
MARLADIRRHLARFLHDERGAAGLEFLFTSPLLFGILVFTAEYGQALRYRIALDGAVQDAARFLARAPAESAEDGAGTATLIAIHPDFLAAADDMVDARLGRDVEVRVAEATLDTENFRTPFHVITVTGTVRIDLPMLAFINLGLAEGIPETLALTATQRARWGAGNSPGHASCGLRDRIEEIC